jgi:hypothetical protein
MNNLKNFINKITLLYLPLTGFLIFGLYFWSRFLRNRTIKNIPYENFSVTTFFILLYICLIFIFVLYILLFSPKKNANLELIIDWIFTPLKEAEKSFRHFIIGKVNFEKFLDKIYPFLDFSINKTFSFYITFWFIPRFLLLTALFIDVFVFHQMNYRYQIILIGILILFNRYFKYSLKNIKEENIIIYKKYVDGIRTRYHPWIHPSELEPDYDPEDPDNEMPYNNVSMTLPVEIFIKFKTESLVYDNIERETSGFDITKEFRNDLWEKYAGHPYVFYYVAPWTPVPPNYKNNFGELVPDNYIKASDVVYKKSREFAAENLDKIMKISILIENLTKASSVNTQIKNLKILIYLNYLICWLYVLIVSLPNLDTVDLIQTLINTYENIPNPFSDIPISFNET